MVTITVEDSEVVKIVVVTEAPKNNDPHVIHIDADMNETCDECNKAVPHVDHNKDGICDIMSCNYRMNNNTAEHEHEDASGNGVCDFPGCTETVTASHSCVDANNDGVCDIENCPNPNGGASEGNMAL
jgi:hypothetical protein